MTVFIWNGDAIIIIHFILLILLKINSIVEIKIYTLTSTRNINNIRYVGKTTQKLKDRLIAHISDSKRDLKNKYTKNYNHNWINKELQEGYQIIITEIDCMNLPKFNWKWLEQYWISQFKTWGFFLTNLTLGGNGNQG